MSENIISKTIEILSKTSIKKPPLNKKLLSKPPFRYLHDLFSEVIKVSQPLFDGLYDEQEMVSENCKDKDSKVAYLSKMIEVLKITTETDLKANPLKIVAGLDVDDTNVMLQALGTVVLKKMDTSSAISKVCKKRGQSASNLVQPEPEQAEPAERTIERTPPPALEEPKIEHQQPTPEPVVERHQTIEPNTPTPPSPLPAAPAAKEEKPASAQKARLEPGKAPSSGKKTPEKSNRAKSSSDKPPKHQQQPQSSELEQAEGHHQEASAASTMVPQAKIRGRPMSARPPPPKIKSSVAITEENSGTVPIHVDGPSQEDDDFIVKAVDDEPKRVADNGGDSLDGQHGGLVNKILQTKRNLEGKDGSGEKDKASTKTLGSVAAKDITLMRETIQSLCQSTNPLGKAMDYLQEDADAMNTELALWKKESATYERQAVQQKQITKESLLPLEEKLSQIEKSIQNQLQKIASLKGEILVNDANTEKMLKSIASAN